MSLSGVRLLRATSYGDYEWAEHTIENDVLSQMLQHCLVQTRQHKLRLLRRIACEPNVHQRECFIVFQSGAARFSSLVDPTCAAYSLASKFVHAVSFVHQMCVAMRCRIFQVGARRAA